MGIVRLPAKALQNSGS